MALIALRPRSGSEIIDVSVRLLRANYATLITIAAVCWIPEVFVQLMFRAELSTPTGAYDHTAIFLLSTLVQTLALMVADGASVIVISDMYLGGRTRASDALARVWPRLPTLVGASIMRNLITGFAFILLIVPGIYVSVRSFTLGAVAMLERRDSGGTWSRSWELGEDNVGAIFLPVATASVLYFVLATALQFLMMRLAIPVPVLRTSGVSLVVGNLGAVFFHPLVSVARTAVYYDLRVRKEGLDVEVMANELGGPVVA